MTGLALIVVSQVFGDTLRWYDPKTIDFNCMGTGQPPRFHWAILLPIDSSLDGRTVHSGRVHICEPMDSSGILRLCKGFPPNVIVLDSGSFYSTEFGFYEVPFGDTIVLNQGDEIWLWCSYWQNLAEYPATADAGPAVRGFGDWVSTDGTVWFELYQYGFDYNWVMELILTPLDVKEGPARPREFFMHITSSNPIKGVLKLQYGISPEDEGLVSLKIYDVSGRTVKTIFSERKEAGFYELIVPVGQLSAGTYFLRLETPKRALTERVIIKG
jgi:hypothetical protein